MSKFKQGILGGFSGKVGTVIGGSWKGIDYMRGIAARVSNPRTQAQLNQRAKFAATIKFLQPLTPFLRVGFKNQAVKMSAFNAAMSFNIHNAITGTYPAYEIDYANALISRGTLPEALNPSAVSAVAGKIAFTWQDNSQDANAMPDDKALLVVYNPVKQHAITIVDGNTRLSGSQVITLPASFSGDEVQCYISFANANQSVLSNSQFIIGLIVL